MSRRQRWRAALAIELARWSAKPMDELLTVLEQPQIYETTLHGQSFQVEVHLLEITEDYIHVAVSVDDGTLPAAIVPASGSFICRKSC